MAIDTNDKKMSLLTFNQVWQPNVILDETASFDQGDKQQLLWGYPGILFGAPPEVDETVHSPRFLINLGTLINR